MFTAWQGHPSLLKTQDPAIGSGKYQKGRYTKARDTLQRNPGPDPDPEYWTHGPQIQIGKPLDLGIIPRLPVFGQCWEVGSSNLAEFADPAPPHMYSHAVLDAFADLPNISRPDNTCSGTTHSANLHISATRILNSDGEFEGNSVYDDDYDVDWVEPDPGSDDEASTPTDVSFDPALVDAAGGMDAVARGAVPASVPDYMRVGGWAVPQLKTPFPYMNEPYDTRPDGWIREDYPGIYAGDHDPTVGSPNAASAPLGAFLRFVTPQLLEKTAGTSNAYFKENLETRVQAQHAKQQARQEKKPDLQAQTPQQIKANLQKLLIFFW
ncbi:unnamed protein product [Phytophthora fragariaefolia]|uniref:Unnamed protein product n=1 Tax=Phytophthora fragariaefolia TaxID=1490495 RepID=A0A9W6TTD3_9STRA|nr:unnamed protein product [Phytophthora fragariaefolia]